MKQQQPHQGAYGNDADHQDPAARMEGPLEECFGLQDRRVFRVFVRPKF
jgi:hypothetical protein